MTTAAIAYRPARAAATRGRVTFPHLLRAEWLKLATLKSTWLSLGLLAVLTATLAPILTNWIAGHYPVDEIGPGGIFAVGVAAQFALNVGIIVLPVFGALAATGEFKAGQLQGTFLAAPRRLTAVTAKAVVTALVAAGAALAALGLATLADLIVLRAHGVAWEFPAATWRVAGGAVAGLVAMALFAHAIGWLVRSSALAISLAVVVLFVVPQLLTIATGVAWVGHVYDFWPSTVAMGLTQGDITGVPGGAPGGFALLAAYGLVPLVGAAVAALKRDA
jgi:ABC-2 type transport system permease protein